MGHATAMVDEKDEITRIILPISTWAFTHVKLQLCFGRRIEKMNLFEMWNSICKDLEQD